MSTDNTIVISDTDPDGLKAAIQTQFEASRDGRDTIADATDLLSVSPSQPGNPVAPSVSSLEEDFPLEVAGDPVAPTVSDVFADWPLPTDTVSGRQDIDLNGTL